MMWGQLQVPKVHVQLRLCLPLVAQPAHGPAELNGQARTLPDLH